MRPITCNAKACRSRWESTSRIPGFPGSFRIPGAAPGRRRMRFAWPVRPRTLAQDRADVWDSGRVESDQSVNVPYSGPAVESRRRYYWQVRVWDPQGQASPYSQASWWEMGLLSPQDWKAKWITRDMPLERGDYESAPKWIWAADDNALTNATPGKHDFRFSFKLAQKTQRSHALHHRQGQRGSLGQRQAGRGRVADGQVRPSARSVGIFPGHPGRQAAERRRQFRWLLRRLFKRSTTGRRRLASSRFCESRWRTAKSNASFPDRNGRPAPEQTGNAWMGRTV